MKSRGGSRSRGDEGISDGLLGGAIGYMSGSSGNNVSLGDGIKYQVKCSADDQSDYCQNVRSFNEFQMFMKIITALISFVVLLIAIYYIYTIYFSKKK